MKRNRFLAFALIAVFTVWASASLAATDKYDIQHRINSAARAVEQMSDSSTSKGMSAVLMNSRGVAIFPNVTKAGLIVGARFGEGIMLTRDQKGRWYGPTFYSIGGGSFGLQAGIASVAVMMTVNTADGLKAFRGGTFTLGANVGAVAGPGGRDASVGAASNGPAPLYTYSISKGLFAGIALDGSAISELPNVNKAYWKKPMTPADCWKVRATDKRVQPLIKALNKLMKVTKYGK